MLSIKSGNLLNILTGANKMQLPGSLLRVTVASSNIINETLFCFVLLKNASLEWYSLLIHIFIPKLHPERGFALHKAARGQVSFQKPEPTGSRRALGVFTGARGGTACTGTELFSGVLGSTPSTVQGLCWHSARQWEDENAE